MNEKSMLLPLFQVEISNEIGYGNSQIGTTGEEMAAKRVSEILKLVEFLNEEVKEVSKRLSRVTPREVSERLGALALLRERILALQIELPQDLEKKLNELYPSLHKDRIRPS